MSLSGVEIVQGKYQKIRTELHFTGKDIVQYPFSLGFYIKILSNTPNWPMDNGLSIFNVK